MKKDESGRETKLEIINDNIVAINKDIIQLQETVSSMKTPADDYAFQAEEKVSFNQIKILILKSNELK